MDGVVCASPGRGESVVRITCGLETLPMVGEERSPRAFSGEEMGLGEIVLCGKSFGDGLDEVGLATRRAAEEN